MKSLSRRKLLGQSRLVGAAGLAGPALSTNHKTLWLNDSAFPLSLCQPP